MEVKTKEWYETPTVQVAEVKTEGIVCASQKDYGYWGDDEDD